MSNLYVISSKPLTPEALAALMARLRAAATQLCKAYLALSLHMA
jgi:hypothetical protein